MGTDGSYFGNWVRLQNMIQRKRNLSILFFSQWYANNVNVVKIVLRLGLAVPTQPYINHCHMAETCQERRTADLVCVLGNPDSQIRNLLWSDATLRLGSQIIVQPASAELFRNASTGRVSRNSYTLGEIKAKKKKKY